MSGQQRVRPGSTQWSTHDPACNHCRTRKIKCGREHPRCANCKRDGVQCDFSDQGKRINHIKLLVDNFGGLEGRLVSIEKGIGRLTDSIQLDKEKSQIQPYNMSPRSDSPQSKGSGRGLDESDDQRTQKRKREQLYQLAERDGVDDRYHEPCTLLSLCIELRDLNMKTQRKKSRRTSRANSATSTPSRSFGEDISREETANGLLTTLCSVVSAEVHLAFNNVSDNDLPILLPPKQFLVMACSPFFQQENPAIDLFCQSTFWANVHRIYSKPFASVDNAWALCFNNIILLVLGAGQPGHGSDTVMGSQFAVPFISTLWSALAYPEWLETPKLINVQALALLSYTAQQQLQPSFAEATLARACQLAKRMGLHQQRLSGARTPSEEDDERLKVFRSLFLRDKSLSITRGVNCWLPSLDCSISFALGKSLNIGIGMYARLQLARLQEEIYRALYSSESFPLSTYQRRAAIFRIEESLRQWAEAYEDPESAEVVHAADVQLDFRASRILALRSSSEPRHMEQVVLDARVSCHLLSMAVGQGTINVPLNPEVLLGTLVPKNPFTAHSNDSEHAYLRVHSLAESFSVPAFFALVRNIIWPVVENPEEGDVELLKTVSKFFESLSSRTQENTYIHRVSKTFQSLVSIVLTLKPDLAEDWEEPKDQDQRQYGHHGHPIHHIAQLTPMPTTSSANFVNSTSAMMWPPLRVSEVGMPNQSASYITTANPPTFSPVSPMEYDVGIAQYSNSRLVPTSSQEQYSENQGYVMSHAWNMDYQHQPFFSHFDPTMPLDGGQQQVNSRSI